MSAKLKNFFLGVMLYSYTYAVIWPIVFTLSLSHLRESLVLFFERQSGAHQIFILVVFIMIPVIICGLFIVGIAYIIGVYLKPLLHFRISFIPLMVAGVLAFLLIGFLPGKVQQASDIIAMLVYFYITITIV